MRNDFESNYLAHHGILGMKWGRKNGPPYPLGASDHSASEKKAGYKKSLGGGRNESLYNRASKKVKAYKQSVKDDQAARAKKEAERAHKNFDPYLNAMDKKAEKRQRQADEYREKNNTTQAEVSKDQLSKKAQKISDKYDKKIAKSQKRDEKILNAREANKSKKIERFDKKIEKVQRDIDSYEPIKNGLKDKKGRDILTKKDVDDSIAGLKKVQNDLESKKKAWVDDFDQGTKYVKKGQDRYNSIIKNYKNAKLSAVEDAAYKNDQKYKKAVKEYVNQKSKNILYSGSQGTKLNYAIDVASEELRKNSTSKKKQNRR